MDKSESPINLFNINKPPDDQVNLKQAFAAILKPRMQEKVMTNIVSKSCEK